jgi:hypothetical protein
MHSMIVIGLKEWITIKNNEISNETEYTDDSEKNLQEDDINIILDTDEMDPNEIGSKADAFEYQIGENNNNATEIEEVLDSDDEDNTSYTAAEDIEIKDRKMDETNPNTTQ